MSRTAQVGECCILVAARSLFAQKGYDAVSMSRIAAQAGVSKANLYHHYQSKEKLYFSVLRDAGRDDNAIWDRLADTSRPVVERIRAFAREQLRVICANPTHVRLVMREVAEEHSEHQGRQLAEEIFGSDYGRVVALFEEGRKRGELKPGINPALVASLLMSANMAFFQWHDVMRHIKLAASFADDSDAYADSVVEVLLDGIACADTNRTHRCDN